MYLWFMSNPDLTHEMIVGREARSEAGVRAVYRIVSGGLSAVSQLARLAKRFGEAYGRWQRRRMAMRTLQGLDDRLLGDIGVARGDIRRLVEETADQPPMTIPELAQREAEREAARAVKRRTLPQADSAADEPLAEDLRLAA